MITEVARTMRADVRGLSGRTADVNGLAHYLLQSTTCDGDLTDDDIDALAEVCSALDRASAKLRSLTQKWTAEQTKETTP